MAEDKKHRLSQKQKDMLAALEKTALNVRMASTMVTTGKTIHYKWLKSNPKYAEAVDEIRGDLLDLAESKLILNVKKGDQKAVQYFLDNQGAERGYGKKLQVTGKGGGAVEHKHSVTPETVAQARKALRDHFK